MGTDSSLQTVEPITSTADHHVLRLAPRAVADRYPLHVAGAVNWRRHADHYLAQIDLPPLPAGWLIVPSLSIVEGTDYGFRFDLAADGAGHWPLAPVRMPPDGAPSTGTHVSTHLDCWHTHAALSGARLTVRVASAREPTNYLLSVSARPQQLTADSGLAITRELTVPALSQMTADAAIRRRICSPACVTMLLAHSGIAVQMSALAARCHDAAAGIYGMWPLAIHAASAHGMLGAIETFTRLDDVAPVLELGRPVIASIDFERGGLDGSPLERSSGHLVVVRGLGAHQVAVNDPAADADPLVERHYDRRQLAAAWLDRRGVAYVLLPPEGAA
jgi:hypothetical protein